MNNSSSLTCAIFLPPPFGFYLQHPPGGAQLGIGIYGSVTRSFCVPCLKFLNLKLVKNNLQSVSFGKNTAGLLPPPLQTDWSKRSQLHLDQRRAAQTAARDQDLPGCHCRVTGEGAEKWRDAGGRQVLSLTWTVRVKDVVAGREERKMNGA